MARWKINPEFHFPLFLLAIVVIALIFSVYHRLTVSASEKSHVTTLEACKQRWFIEITWHQWYNEMALVYKVDLAKGEKKPPPVDHGWVKHASQIFDDAIEQGHNSLGMFEKLEPVERCKALLAFLSVNGVPPIPHEPYDLTPVIVDWIQRSLKDEAVTQK